MAARGLGGGGWGVVQPYRGQVLLATSGGRLSLSPSHCLIAPSIDPFFLLELPSLLPALSKLPPSSRYLITPSGCRRGCRGSQLCRVRDAVSVVLGEGGCDQVPGQAFQGGSLTRLPHLPLRSCMHAFVQCQHSFEPLLQVLRKLAMHSEEARARLANRLSGLDLRGASHKK